MLRTVTTLEALREEILRVGFLPYGGSSRKFPFSLAEATPNDWYTGRDDDPWGWRMEIARSGNIAYGKFFQGLAGFIAVDCLPAFVALRREGLEEEDFYADGLLSRDIHQIYLHLCAHPGASSHEVKKAFGWVGKEGSRFDQAVNRLQRLLLVCICGEGYKINKLGFPYGWPSSAYTTLDERFPDLPLMEAAQAKVFLLERAALACDAPAEQILPLLYA